MEVGLNHQAALVGGGGGRNGVAKRGRAQWRDTESEPIIVCGRGFTPEPQFDQPQVKQQGANHLPHEMLLQFLQFLQQILPVAIMKNAITIITAVIPTVLGIFTIGKEKIRFLILLILLLNLLLF